MYNKIKLHIQNIKRLQKEPLANYVDKFVKKWISEDYSFELIKMNLNVLGNLNTWLIKQNLDLKKFDLNKINKFKISNENRLGKYYFKRGGYRAAIDRIVKELNNENIIPFKIIPIIKNEVDIWIEKFIDYSHKERGLTDGTIKNNIYYIRKFLSEKYNNNKIIFKNLTGKELLNYIQQSTFKKNQSYSKRLVNALRSFLRYLEQSGEITSNLSINIPPVANRKLTNIPNYLLKNEIQQLLTSCNKKTKQGRRDYAILLLFSRLGLRASEVINITLEDIYWDQGEILIKGKGPRQNKFPIPEDIGKAIVDYLKNSRPICASRNLFITVKAPFRKLGNPSSIDRIVSSALTRAKLNPLSRGAHLLRYSAATMCLSNGARIHDIGDFLRHRSINTTAIYTKININKLRTLAKKWP